MRRLGAAFLLIAVALGLLASPALAKSGKARLTPVPGQGFLQRSFVLTLPTSRELAPTQVKVTENGQPVSRLSVTPAHAVGGKRFAEVLVIDASRSMRGRAIRDAMAAARAFAARRNPGQQLAAITFNRKAVVALPLTADKLAIDSTLSKLPALGGGTHLYDAVAQ